MRAGLVGMTKYVQLNLTPLSRGEAAPSGGRAAHGGVPRRRSSPLDARARSVARSGPHFS